MNSQSKMLSRVTDTHTHVLHTVLHAGHFTQFNAFCCFCCCCLITGTKNFTSLITKLSNFFPATEQELKLTMF